MREELHEGRCDRSAHGRAGQAGIAPSPASVKVLFESVNAHVVGVKYLDAGVDADRASVKERVARIDADDVGVKIRAQATNIPKQACTLTRRAYLHGSRYFTIATRA